MRFIKAFQAHRVNRTLILAAAAMLFSAGIASASANEPVSDKTVHGRLLGTSIRQWAEREGLQIGGFLESRNQVRIHDPDDLLSLRQRLHLEASLRRGGVGLFADVQCDHDPAFRSWGESEHVYRLDLHEIYLTVDSPKVDLFAGKKIIRWGTADLLSPLDLINPLDVLDPIDTVRRDVRLPIWLADLVMMFPTMNLEFVFVPKAEVNELPEPGNPWEPAGLRNIRERAEEEGFRWQGADKPDTWLKDVEVGVRNSFTRQGIDLDLIYFRGYADTPVIDRSFSGFFNVTLTPRYEPFQAFGCAFAKGFERSTVRGELAFKTGMQFSIDPEDPSYLSDPDGLAKRDLVQGVLGVDRTVSETWFLNGEVFWDRIEDGSFNLLSERQTYGVACEVRGKFLEDDLVAGVRGILTGSGEGGAYEIFAEYHYGDICELTLGSIWFEGRKGTRFGQYDANDMVYLKFRSSF